MEGLDSFDLAPCSSINPDASLSPAKYYGHVYSFDFSSPQTSFSVGSLGFSSHNLTSVLFREPQRNFISENHAISTRAFTAVGKQKSAQGDDVLPQIPASICSNLSPAKSSNPVFPSLNALSPSLLPQAWIDETPADGRAGSPTCGVLPFSSSQTQAYTYDLAYTHANRDAYNTLRTLLSTPGSSRRSKISSTNMEPTSCFLPSGSSTAPTSSLIDNMASIYRFLPDEIKEDIRDATLGTNQSDVSPVIHKPESRLEPSFRLRKADFAPAKSTNDDDLPIPTTKKYSVNSACKDVDFSSFILQTPKKSRTTKYAATAALVAHSPLTPMTDDERISDPSFMKDNLPQNPSSSPAMNSARKRSFDFIETLSPSYPPKRARSNRLLALKEKERFAAGKDDNDSSDAFSSLEKSSTVTPIPITLIPRKTRANFNRQLTGSSSTSSATPSSSSSSSSSSTDPLTVFTQRTLPSLITLDNKIVPLEISDDIFPLFYRRFPASSYFKLQDQDSSECAIFKKPHPGGTYNPPRNAFDLYTPRFVKGKGKDKMGMCPICIEDIERGGQGKKVWLAMKYSAYKCYHMQYSHGISASSSYPFSPPLAFRITTRSTNHKSEKTRMKEGKCHNCLKWVPVEGIKDVEVKVKELFWWKHAATCHASTTIQGEADVFEEDEVYAKLKELGPAAEERKR